MTENSDRDGSCPRDETSVSGGPADAGLLSVVLTRTIDMYVRTCDCTRPYVLEAG